MSSKANLLIKVMVKESAVFTEGCHARGPIPHWIKRLKFPNGFQGKVRERVVGCVISSWSFFQLVGSEVIGSQHH